MNFRTQTAAFAAMIVLLVPRLIHAEFAEATRAATPPNIDGNLDDACWQQTKPIKRFTIMNSAEPAKFPTVAYVVYDDDAIYIGARCEEPKIANIKTSALPRDHDDVPRHDCVEIMLDPAMSRNDYYHFAVDASGNIFDRACTQGGHIGDKSWDAEVTARSVVGDKFWSCEMAIPFYNHGLTREVKTVWGLNICREKQHPAELSSIAEKGAFNIAGCFVELRGIETDFSRYGYHLGSPAATTLVRDGALDVELSVPLLNETGKEQNFLLDCCLISPTGKPHIVSKPVSLAAGDKRILTAGRFTLVEQGDFTCMIRIGAADTKKPLAIKRSALRIEYIPLTIRLLEPWYRNAIFETQRIKQVVLDLEARMAADELKGTTAEVGIREAGSDRPLESVKITEVTVKNRLHFDADKLPYGKLEILAELKDSGGKTLVTTAHPFQKLPHKKGEVWLGKDMHWRVDGKPFFINGAWNHEEDFLPEYNVFTSEKPGGVKFLSTKLLSEVFYKIGARMREKQLNAADIEMCRGITREVKDNPALFAHYLSDEPECRSWSASALEQAYQAVRDEDPYHPVVISNDSTEGLNAYAGCAEINGLHPYPAILKDKPVNDLSKVISYVEIARTFFRDRSHKQTIAYLHQGFNYGDYGAVNNRIPNYREYRNQDLLALICGVTGFLQFNREVAHYPELSIGMAHLTRELAYLGPVVLASCPSGIEPGSTGRAMKMLLKELDGDWYLFACNAAMTPGEATVTIPGLSKRAKRLQVISEDRMIEVKKDALTDQFDTFETHVYTTATKKPDLLAVKDICRLIDEANQKRKKAGNLAFQMFEGDGVIVRASSVAGKYRRGNSGLWHLVDGVIDTGESPGADTHTLLRWKDTTPNEFPDWVEIQLPAAHPIDKVIVYPFKKSLKDYAIQAFVGDEWQDVDRASGKNEDVITHTFGPVTTNRIRLWITATNGPHAWISEVEVYEK